MDNFRNVLFLAILLVSPNYALSAVSDGDTPVRVAGFHLHENKGALLLGDDVDLTQLGSIVGLEDTITCSFQKIRGQTFALFAKLLLPIEHELV